MAKLILVSMLFMTIAIPMRAAADPSPTRGMRRTIVGLAAFVFVYVMLLVFIVPRLPA